MQCKVDQDLRSHLEREDLADDTELIIGEMADHIIHDLDQFDELFAEETVSIAAVKYIHGIITKNCEKETIDDWRELTSAINKQARIAASKQIKEK